MCSKFDNGLLRYELTDPRAQNIVRLITESIQVEHLRFLFALPPLRYILPEQTGWNKQKEVIEETSALMRDIVTQQVMNQQVVKTSRS